MHGQRARIHAGIIYWRYFFFFFSWMHDGCKVYIDSYMASNGACFMVTWTLSPKPSLGGRSHTKLRDHGTPNAESRWFIQFYHVWGPAWIEIYWNSTWLRARSRMTSHYTGGSMTTLHDFGGVLGQALDTFFSGSHNFMVTALGSCAKWPYCNCPLQVNSYR